MRRRRKTRYNWIPSDGTAVASGAHHQDFQAFSLQINLGTGADSALSGGLVSNILADFNPAEDDAASALGQSMGSEYLLRRIVGKAFVAIGATTATANPTRGQAAKSTALVTLGFFVAPFGYVEASGDRNISQPIGIEGDPLVTPYNPQLTITNREPWIWRRSWMLNPFGPSPALQVNNAGAPQFIIATDTDNGVAFPATNTSYGSVLDGPHIDAKTARRIRKHERLWVAMTAAPYPEGSTIDPDVFAAVRVTSTIDVRCLGVLRRAKNRSSFE